MYLFLDVVTGLWGLRAVAETTVQETCGNLEVTNRTTDEHHSRLQVLESALEDSQKGSSERMEELSSRLDEVPLCLVLPVFVHDWILPRRSRSDPLSCHAVRKVADVLGEQIKLLNSSSAELTSQFSTLVGARSLSCVFLCQGLHFLFSRFLILSLFSDVAIPPGAISMFTCRGVLCGVTNLSSPVLSFGRKPSTKCAASKEVLDACLR